jgi:hypothetical protein
MEQILHNNGYDISIMNSLLNKKKKEKEKGYKKTQCTKFTYAGKEIRAITKTFTNTNIKSSTHHKLSKLLKTNRHRTKQT